MSHDQVSLATMAIAGGPIIEELSSISVGWMVSLVSTSFVIFFFSNHMKVKFEKKKFGNIYTTGEFIVVQGSHSLIHLLDCKF